ncbi:lytic transglycosylase domain-containing protein [Acinetobacter thermotolerans]|uniref:lytic transglycosylase domain-containing protein n=1 Tax=Acinetobacter thermotolerans TaxID=3151487 RepID=UPI00325B964A
MGNWLAEYTDEDQKQVDELNAKGIAHAPTKTKEESSGLFSIAAPLRGAAAGFAKAADTITKPIDAVVDRVGYSFKDVQTDEIIEPYSAYKEKQQKAREDLVYESIDYLKDEENTGTIGNIAFSLGDYATRAVVGSAIGGVTGAAAVTGASEADYVYGDLVRDGVDSETAMKVAATDGVVAAVSTALPISYGFKGGAGVAADAVLSVGGASALSQGGQAVSGNILDNAGYEKQAKKYEVTGEAVATDVLLNTLFFGAARGAGKYLNQNADLTPEQIEANVSKQQAALVLNELEFENTLAPVKPSNPVQQNNHLKNLDAATESLRMGRPVNVSHPVKGEEKQKPVNYESMAMPSNAKAIARKAQQEGVNPSVALTIAHIETAGTFSHTAKNPTSTAHGLFQILDKTWKGQGGGDRHSIDEQIKQGLKHIKNANAAMRKGLGREPVAHEQYLGHLLGPGGATAVLKADPNAKLIDVVRKYDPKNAADIVKNNGMSGLTVGQAIDKWRTKWNSLSARYSGNGTSTAYGMDGSSYDFAYEVKSLGELIASNDAAYGVNPLYPAELQPRDRTREASRQQIESMAENLKPELLGESYKLSDGAPIIGMDNVVESGNGRTLAITKAYESGRAEEYRSYIEQYAREKGWDISGIDRPVLVRTRLTDTDRAQFAKLANESDVAQFSATERAVSDADRLPDASLLKINSDGSINLDGSMDYVRGFIQQLPKAEQGAAITPDGRLSQDGKRRIESAIMHRAYDDPNIIARMAENLDDDSKTVLNALLRVAPQLAQLGDLVKQGGRHQNTIAKDLAQAAQKFSDLKAADMRVDDYLNQGQLIDDGLSDGAKQFLNVFDQNSRSAKGIAENIQGKINEIEAMGDPRQGSLFGDGPEEAAALDVILQNPDQQISVSRMRPGGEMEEITMSLRERLDELEAEARQAQEDTLAAQTAISCALQFGE